MKRVAHITLSMQAGGIENLILSLVRHGDADRFAFYCYCLDEAGSLLQELEAYGTRARIMHRKPGLDLFLIMRLARAIRQDGIDVIHTHNQAAHFYGCLAGRLAGIRNVLNTEHSRHFIDERPRRRLEKRVLSFLSSRMVTVSKELLQASIERDRIKAAKLQVVENGIDVERFNRVSAAHLKSLRQGLGLARDERVVSIIARLHPIKNHELLLQAVQKVRLQETRVRLLVVGDGELRAELEKKACQLGLAGHVLFLGDRRDIPDIMHLSEVMVLCSKREGLPLVLLEGMASGVPLVVTSGANRSLIVEHGRTGLQAKATAEDIAAKILCLLQEPRLAKKLTDEAKSAVQKMHSIQKTVQAYQNLYLHSSPSSVQSFGDR